MEDNRRGSKPGVVLPFPCRYVCIYIDTWCTHLPLLHIMHHLSLHLCTLIFTRTWMDTGYEWEQCGYVAHYSKYSNPPSSPVLLPLTGDCEIHQTAICFPTQVRQPGMKTPEDGLVWGEESSGVFITPRQVYVCTHVYIYIIYIYIAPIHSPVCTYFCVCTYMHIYTPSGSNDSGN